MFYSFLCIIPHKIKDSPKLLNDRDSKIARVVHAEFNAIIFARQDLADCSIVCCPFRPCSQCCKAIIQAGITRVVSPSYIPNRWKEDFLLSTALFAEANVEQEFVDFE